MASLIIDLIFIAIFIAFAVSGYKKGFIKSAIPLLSFILALIISCLLTGALSSVIYDKYIMPAVTESVFENLKTDVGENEDSLGISDFISENTEKFKKIFDRWGADSEDVAEKAEKINSEETDGEPYRDHGIIDSLAKTIAAPVAKVISNIIAFVILFILSYIAARICLGLLNVLSKIALLDAVNKACGLIIGTVNALFIIWLITLLISHFLPEMVKLFPDTLNAEMFEKSVIYCLFRDYNIWTVVKHYLL